MGSHDDVRTTNPAPDPREMGKWARRYAQNRSLPVLISLVALVGLSVVMALAPILAVEGYRAGHLWLAGLGIVLVVLAMAATIYLSVPRWHQRFRERLAGPLYAAEGTAQMACPSSPQRLRAGKFLAAGFGACILLSVALGSRGWISPAMMQPVSALYCVPFLMGIWWLQRPASSPVMLLWPALYTLHAVAVLLGAPIQFSDRWSFLNMLIPVAGHGILSTLMSHLYSRYALRKLRRLGGSDGEEAEEEPA